jgi:hypothetical protein
VAGAVLMSTLIATFSGAVQQFNGIPASEKPHVIVVLRHDAQTVSNSQISAWLVSKHQPEPLVQKFVQFKSGRARQGPAERARRDRRARPLRLRHELLPARWQEQEAGGGGGAGRDAGHHLTQPA